MAMATTETILACPACEQRNRVVAEAAGKTPVCGRCGAELTAPPAGPVTVTDATFEAEVLRAPVPVLLDCWAPWCGPCRRLGPTIDQLAEELAGQVKVVKLDVDENPRVAALLGIQGIPALKLFRDGQVIDEMVGAAPKGQILRWLRSRIQVG